MKCQRTVVIVSIAGVLAVMGDWVIAAQEKQDKYTLKVPGGLAFSEFKGYEDWPAASAESDRRSKSDQTCILANPTIIDAYKRGAPRQWRGLPRRLQDRED